MNGKRAFHNLSANFIYCFSYIDKLLFFDKSDQSDRLDGVRAMLKQVLSDTGQYKLIQKDGWVENDIRHIVF